MRNRAAVVCCGLLSIIDDGLFEVGIVCRRVDKIERGWMIVRVDVIVHVHTHTTRSVGVCMGSKNDATTSRGQRSSPA